MLYRFEWDTDVPQYLINTPLNEEFTFTTINHSTYRRCGNVLLTISGCDRRRGTLYLTEDYAWVLINREGLVFASGSAGSFPKPIKETVVDIRAVEPEPYRNKSRFDDIGMWVDEENDKGGTDTRIHNA
jgi:hypothetical protein